MSYLVLVRHGKSEWNEKGLWTGWTDVELHPDGVQDAHNMASHLKDIQFDMVFTSVLKRTRNTAEIILQDLEQSTISSFENEALNERNYGIYTGKNKWEVKKEVGEEEFQQIRRAWNHPIPEGEDLKQVYERVVPYYEEHILPELKEGKNVLVVSSNNPLRALVKYLDKISEEEVGTLEIGIGEVLVYQIDEEGTVLSKEIRAENPDKGKI